MDAKKNNEDAREIAAAIAGSREEDVDGKQERPTLDDLLKIPTKDDAGDPSGGNAEPPALDSKRILESLTSLDSGAGEEEMHQAARDRIREARKAFDHEGDSGTTRADGCERPTLESLLREAAAKAGASEKGQTPTKSANNLFSGYMDILMDIAGKFGDFAPLSGPGGLYGFEHPNITLRREVQSGNLDDVPMDDYNLVLKGCETMAKLWEGQESMQGTQLARNAILYVALHDSWLRARAVSLAQELLAEHCAALKKCNYRPV